MDKSKRSFMLIIISQVINMIGGMMLRFTLSLHVLDLTGSAEIFATMIAVSSLPIIIFTPLGGVIADRISKRRLMVILDSTNAVLVGILAMLLFGGSESVALITVVITAMSLVSTCYGPVVNASLPAILEKDELLKANGLVQGIISMAGFIAPVLAGILFGIVGVNNMVLISSGLFLFAALNNIFIAIPHAKRESAGGALKTVAVDLKAGFVHIAKTDTVLLKMAVILSIIVMMYSSIHAIALPYLVRVTFDMHEQYLGFAQAAMFVSMLSASFIVGKKSIKPLVQLKRMPMLLSVMGTASLPIAISVLLPLDNVIVPYLIFVIGFMLVLFVFSIINIVIMTSVQERVPGELVGKVFGMLKSIINIATPIGQLGLGLIMGGFQDNLFVVFFGVSAVTMLVAFVVHKRKLVISSRRSE